MKMPMLFDVKEKVEKVAYKFSSKGAHRMRDKGMPCIMNKHNH